MNGIYLTQEGKKELENKIVELVNIQITTEDTLVWNKCVNEKNLLKEILSTAKILDEQVLRDAYFSGIKTTGEGWNGEYANGNHPNIEETFKEGFQEWLKKFKNK